MLCQVVANAGPESLRAQIALEHRQHPAALAVRDGIEGVEAAESVKPDIILMDIGMPRLNGYDAARRIRQQPWGAQMILIALTGWGQDSDKRLAQEAGFDHHLTKPVDWSVLQSLLDSVQRAAARP